MVEVTGAMPIGEVTTRAVAPAPVMRVVAASAPAAVASPLGDTAQTEGLAQSMAASAPVDVDRVAKIKRAIAEGRFPILPATIADRLIALKLQWNPSDGVRDGQHDDGHHVEA